MTENPDPIASEIDRHACEVRMVAAMASKAVRASFLDGVRKQRGEAARLRIVEDLQRMAKERNLDATSA